MTAPDLDAIEARADAATPEPWEWAERRRVLVIGGQAYRLRNDADAVFIAHVRADVFALIDYARKLERGIADAKVIAP